MNPSKLRGLHFVPYIAIVSCLSLIVGVIWSSSRALEITDEAYYLLSAIHPEQILLYISAQHWILAPLWRLTESLQGFRLTGAGILLGSGGILGLGSAWMLSQLTGRKPDLTQTIGVMAAGGAGALVYVATIAPSPSYNLLASAGAYAATGCALLSCGRRILLTSLTLCLVAGAALAVCFVNKPSAGICSSLVVCVLVLSLESELRKWLFLLVGIIGAILTLTLLVAVQPSPLPVQVSLSKGLELFRMVQTEPVSTRLIRYATTLGASFGEALVSFWPGLLLMVAFVVRPRRWLAISLLCILVLNILLERNYLAGSLSYQRVMEGIYALLFLMLVCGFRVWSSGGKIALLFGGLFILPFSVAIGTGNSIFTQVIVTLAPWSIIAVLLVFVPVKSQPHRLLQHGLACLFLTMITAQVFTSYIREPYHLQTPLTGQTEPVTVGVLGEVKVDMPTVRFLNELQRAKEVCAIKPGAQFMGLFNVPGLALVFEAVPPVSPWLNNTAQAEVMLKYWAPESANRIVMVLTREVHTDMLMVPERLNPKKNGYVFCGNAEMPFENHSIEVWASAVKPSN
jgi:hypothetical protein